MPAFVGWLLTNLLVFAWSVDRHQSLFGERYWYRGLLTVLLEGGFFLIARLGFGMLVRQLWWLVAGIAIGGTVVAGVVGSWKRWGRISSSGWSPRTAACSPPSVSPTPWRPTS